MHLALHISAVSWAQAELELRHIREQVFIVEQSVPIDLEWDGLDADALHIIVRVHQQAVACARLLSNQHLGRMAVLSEWRGQGIGTHLLQFAIQHARTLGWHNIFISAQCHALDFYRKHGFMVASEAYLDAGISHCDMQLSLR